MRIRLALVVLIATLPALLLAPGVGLVQRRPPTDVSREDATPADVGVSREIARAEPDRILGDDLMAIGAVALGGLAMIWLGGELFLLRRVRRVVRRAERLIGDDPATRIGHGHAGDEVGRLEGAVDALAASIERGIAERTRLSQALARSEARCRAVADQVDLVNAERDHLRRALADSEARCRVAGEQLVDVGEECRRVTDERARQVQRLDEVTRTSSSLLMALALGGAVARQRAEDTVREARQEAEREAERLRALRGVSAALASPDANLYQIIDDLRRPGRGGAQRRGAPPER